MNKSQKAGDWHFWNSKKKEYEGDPEKLVESTLKLENLVELLKNQLHYSFNEDIFQEMGG